MQNGSSQDCEIITKPTESVLNRFLKKRPSEAAKQPNMGVFKNGMRNIEAQVANKKAS